MPHRFVHRALLALVCCSGAASAVPTGPISCAGVPGEGGCPPYAQVIFWGGNPSAPGSLFEYDGPLLDISDTGQNGTVRGVVDLAGGVLRSYARGFDDGNPSTNNGVSMSAVAVDIFTLHRLGAPSPDFFTFSIVLTAEGVGAIDTPFYTVASYLHLDASSVPGYSGGRPDDARVLQSVSHVPVFQQFTLGMMVYANVSARLDEPFQLGMSLRTDVSEASFLDMLHTARLSFVLPEGVTVTSMGGYDSTTLVPEPSSWALLGAGLLTVMLRRRR